jgi:hypothetical protein
MSGAKAVFLGLGIAILSGCAMMPPHLPPIGPTPKPIAIVRNPVRVVPDAMQIGLSSTITGPCDQPVSIQTTGKAEVKDLAPLLYAQGIALVYGDSGDKGLYLPQWSGSICQFGAMLADYLGGSWSWDGHTLTIGSKRTVTGYLPASLVKTVRKDFSSLGIPVKVSALGVFSGDLDRNEYRTLRAYFARLKRGVALITLQVAAVSLHQSYSHGAGFDWQSFAAALGSPNLLRNAAGTVAAVAGSAAGYPRLGGGLHYPGGRPAYSGTQVSTTTTAPATANGGSLGFKGGSLSLSGHSPSVSVSSVIHLLSTYGKIALLQNASIQALSGTSVDLKSITKTPYVSGVGVGGYGVGTGASSAASSGRGFSGLGLAQTSTATAGLTLKITPIYSPGQSYVTLKIKASLNSVQQFVNLSAGNQIGSLTQPVTQQQSLDSSVAVPAGRPAVIGGLVYTSRNTQQAAPNGFYGLADHSVKTTRDRLFIIVRPTVTLYRPGRPARRTAVRRGGAARRTRGAIARRTAVRRAIAVRRTH